ncbi:hypothetical protein ACYOEI_30995 [Singulisphaera rosea]
MSTGLPVSTLNAVASGKTDFSKRVREALAKRFAMHPSSFV